MVPSIIASVSGFMQMSLIYLESGFVQGDRPKSTFILLPMDKHSPEAFFENAFFYLPNILDVFVKYY